MTPEERQLISGLFERMRPAANQQRDREAETFIGDQLRAQPYAPYLLSQTVIVQDQALRAANDKIEQLESQAREAQAQPQETSFLGSVGRSIFGGGPPDNRNQTVPATGRGFGENPQDQGQYRAQGNPGGSPWGQAAGGGIGGAMSGMGGAMGGGGGGFLKGALGAAAGVAGGVLLADGIRNLFSGGHNPYGIASGMGDMAGGLGNPGGETIVNNYYDNPDQGGGDFDGGQNVADGGDFAGGFDDGGDYDNA